MQKQNFTKSFIESLEPALSGKRDYYKDSKVNFLEVMVTDKGSKSFKVTRKKDGKIIRVTLGQYPDLSIENARKKAYEVNSEIANGINPNQKKNELKQEITFHELFNEFMERYSKKSKKSWKHDEREITKFCSEWFKRKISSITNNEVRLLHERVKNDNGLYQANRILERIRAMYNKAIEWGYGGKNPTQNIKKYKETSRERFIQPDELPRFFEALETELNLTAKDYFYIALYTGARKSNLLAMKWDQVNLVTKEWRIPETKNGEPVRLPLAEEAVIILEARKTTALNDNIKSDWVFPSHGSSGHFAEPKSSWKRILARAKISDLRIHDIRRTLGSYQAISGASLQIIGKSLGHKTGQATEIYSRINLDPVRASISKALELINSYKNKNSL